MINKDGKAILVNNLKIFLICTFVPFLGLSGIKIGSFGLVVAIMSSVGLLIFIASNIIMGFIMLIYRDKLAIYHFLSVLLMSLLVYIILEILNLDFYVRYLFK